jgi:NADH-quinone oxidoreductase subunit F
MDYKQIYDKALSSSCYLIDPNSPKVYVSASAGNQMSAEVADVFRTEIEKRGLHYKVVEAGSQGYYALEPLVTIEKSSSSSLLYHNITAKTAGELVRNYLMGDNPRPDLAVCNLGTEKITGIPNCLELPLFNLQKRIVLTRCGRIDPKNIDHYILRGGYSGLARVLQMSPEYTIGELRKAGLRGRGGSGYPPAEKWEIVRKDEGVEKYLICNAVDSDPRELTARLLLESDPHSVLEGMLIAAYAVGASSCFIAVSSENKSGIQKLGKALEQMRKYNLLGENILNSGFNLEIEVKTILPSFVSGEETALIRYLEGRPLMPYIRPPYPAVSGFRGKPTLVNNLETLANVTAIFQNSAEWYTGTGTSQSHGTKIITLAGKLNQQYTVEVSLGITIRDIVNSIGGGVPDNKEIKAVQIGGPTGAFLPLELLDTPFAFESLNNAGTIMGSGVIRVFDSDDCGVEMAGEAISFVRDQSCGKCVFCREGSYQIARMMEGIADNDEESPDLDLYREIAEEMKTGCVCDLGRTAPLPFLSSLNLFREDFDVHIKDKRCPRGSK